MKQYLELLNKVLLEGEHRDDRTGVGTRAIFGYQMRFNLKEGFPLITTKSSTRSPSSMSFCGS